MLNQVAAYMSSNAVCVHPKETARRAFQLMSEMGIHHLPIIENRKVIGMVSFRDLLPYIKFDTNGDVSVKEISLSSLAKEPAKTIQPFASIMEAVQMMLRNAIDALSVIDFKGELIGVLTSRDILSGGKWKNNRSHSPENSQSPLSFYDGSDSKQEAPFYLFETYHNDF